MPSGQPSFILTHHASHINYAITARVCWQQAGPSQQTCGLHALFKQESGVFTLELLSPITPFFFFYLNHMCQVPLPPPLHPLAAVPSHWLPFLSLPPSRCAFTCSLLISPTLCTCTGCLGKSTVKQQRCMQIVVQHTWRVELQ